jgi:titin
LERRLLLSVFGVINTDDSGEGSFRQALRDANEHHGRDTIIFDIPGPGPHTIQPLSPLPTITNAVVIDGTTEPGYDGTPLILLDGQSAGPDASGLVITAGDSEVRGLIIGDFAQDGIQLQHQGGDVVAGTWMGIDATGTTALGNGRYGVGIFSSDNLLGLTSDGEGNVISGNRSDGIHVAANRTRMEGNFVGTDRSGTSALPNGGNGIMIDTGSQDNVIGGTFTGAGNLISGNTLGGVFIMGPNTRGNAVQGNFIGTDVSGTTALPNLDGVFVYYAEANSVGGTAIGADNLISGNQRYGVMLFASSNNNIVQGNRIGTDESGTQPLGNGYTGISVDGSSSGNLIGGTTAGAANTIAFNGNTGVWIVSGTGNAIRRNSIFGHDNGEGISLSPGANSNQPFPTITSAVSADGVITIEGTLTTFSPPATYALEFFVNSVCNYNGYGEGEQFLASLPVTTGPDGTATFSFAVAVSVDPGRFISATATDPVGNTSSFSACAEVAGGDSSRTLANAIGVLPGDATNNWRFTGTELSPAASAPIPPVSAGPGIIPIASGSLTLARVHEPPASDPFPVDWETFPASA